MGDRECYRRLPHVSWAPAALSPFSGCAVRRDASGVGARSLSPETAVFARKVETVSLRAMSSAYQTNTTEARSHCQAS